VFSLQVLGAIAQLERALISERTKAGITAAGKKASCPAIRDAETPPGVHSKNGCGSKAGVR